MRTVIVAILALVPTSLLAADPPAKKEPVELQAARQLLEKDLAAAKATYDAEVKKATNLFVERCTKATKDLTAKGDLDGALAAREAGKTGSKLSEPISLIGQTWLYGNLKIRFEKDGTVSYSDAEWKERGLVVFWKMATPSTVVLQVHRDRGISREMISVWFIDPSGKKYSGSSFEGTPVVGELVH